MTNLVEITPNAFYSELYRDDEPNAYVRTHL